VLSGVVEGAGGGGSRSPTHHSPEGSQDFLKGGGEVDGWGGGGRGGGGGGGSRSASDYRLECRQDFLKGVGEVEW